MTDLFPHLTLVLGGVASGKSAFAETLVRRHTAPPFYLATAEAGDAEMSAKIAQHRARRGESWQTIETPHDTASALKAVPAGHVVLLDCLTMWLSNQLFAKADLAAETDALLASLAGCRSPVIAVSNELGQGGIGADPLTRRFQREQGLLNQRIAAQAETAVLVVAGLPQLLKGWLP